MLQNRAAFITGSVGGIGFAMAEALAGAGCAIMLNGFAEPDLIRQRVDHLRGKYGVRADYHGADLRDPDQIGELVESTKRTFGSVDIAINNAAVRHFGPTEKYLVEDWNESIAVNLSAPFHVCRLVLPHMKAQNWGRIINISSVLGYFAQPERVDYITTKTALLGMTRAIALEICRTNVTCNAICPGTVLTASIEKRLQNTMKQEGISHEEAVTRFMETRTASKRFVRERSIASMALYLCGEGGDDINGSAMSVDVAYSTGR